MAGAAVPVRFADIQWGDAVDAVRGKLRAAGHAPGSLDGEDLWFHARLDGVEADGWVYFCGGRACKVHVTVRPPADRVRGVFDRLRDDLSSGHGPPTSTLEAYDPPYTRVDGRTIEALRLGKARVAAAWQEGPSNRPAGLVLAITPELTVRLSYEAAEWNDEVRRRGGPAAAPDAVPPRRRGFPVWLALALPFAAGVALALSPPGVQAIGVALLGFVASPVVAFAGASGARTAFRRRRIVSGVLFALVSGAGAVMTVACLGWLLRAVDAAG